MRAGGAPVGWQIQRQQAQGPVEARAKQILCAEDRRVEVLDVLVGPRVATVILAEDVSVDPERARRMSVGTERQNASIQF